MTFPTREQLSNQVSCIKPGGKHSTIHPVLRILNHSAEVNKITSFQLNLAIFCNLNKAFDTTIHNILLNKLNTFEISGVIFNHNVLVNLEIARRQSFKRYAAPPVSSIM